MNLNMKRQAVRRCLQTRRLPSYHACENVNSRRGGSSSKFAAREQHTEKRKWLRNNEMIMAVKTTEAGTMKVVALISGGKDSCYNMLQCVAAGHQVVALANLRPESKVGHQGIELYAEALGLPLFRQSTHGVALLHDKVYFPTPEDEVEDLYRLLVKVKLY
ncbi:hypothetical protein LSTR_LSTR017404 [Laodelphax striatellus]|uniref:Diphthine--ammonia ligase n=1 Tax=Laodelphax striatellus TaxID=195883 RepID=A0A482WHU2_LAOST|nr:hypothetical protein LSTR_LSTR017404 [Laodelphax striatellus]